MNLKTLDCKEIQPVHSEGDQPWDCFGRNDAKAETPVLWPPYANTWLIGKDSDAGRDWGQEEKGTTEDEMAGWHHWLDGRWVWVNSRSWWWRGRPGVLQFMGSQRVGHDWATELNCSYMASSVASWPAYRFLKRQVRWSGIPISCQGYNCLISIFLCLREYQGQRGGEFYRSVELPDHTQHFSVSSPPYMGTVCSTPRKLL